MQEQIFANPRRDSVFLVIGTDPLSILPNGTWVQQILTLFVKHKVIVTVPGTHADQRLLYVDYLNKQRAAANLPRLSSQQEYDILEDGAALVAQYDEETNAPFIGVRVDGFYKRACAGLEVLKEFIPESMLRIVGN